MEVITRLNIILQTLGLKQKDLAESIGTTQATLSRQLKGIHKIDKQVALAIQAVHGISSTWLLTGEGEMFVEKKSDKEIKPTDLNLIKEIIEAVEELFNKEDLFLPPKKKAEFIILLYEDLSENQNHINKEDIDKKVIRLTKLAM